MSALKQRLFINLGSKLVCFAIVDNTFLIEIALPLMPSIYRPSDYVRSVVTCLLIFIELTPVNLLLLVSALKQRLFINLGSKLVCFANVDNTFLIEIALPLMPNIYCPADYVRSVVTCLLIFIELTPVNLLQLVSALKQRLFINLGSKLVCFANVYNILTCLEMVWQA